MKRLDPHSRRRVGADLDRESSDGRPQRTDTQRRGVGDGARPADGRDMTVLSIAPGLLIMVTSFTRFIVALSFLRSGLGLQTTPANLVLTSLALFMTLFVMAPTFDKAWQNGLKPLMDNTITQEQAFKEITEPFREFMLSQVREKDISLFEDSRRRNSSSRIGRSWISGSSFPPS